MWSKLRPVIAAVSLLCLTGFFLGLMHISPLAKWQFLPALLAGSFLTAGLVLLLTLFFGRLYCSLLCPLGILQDAVNFISTRRKGFQRRFHYRKEQRALRYGVLGLLALALLAGLASLQILLDPYSIYGRLVTHLLLPLYQQGTGFLAVLGEEYGFISLMRPDFVWQGLAGLLLSLLYLVGIGYLAWRWGRLYCNAVCPVGTILGTVSRFSLFKMEIKQDECVHCGLCERGCRSSCIDAKTGEIDASRCVVCGDCLASCPKHALHFGKSLPGKTAAANGSTPVAKGPVLSRRAMLGTTVAAAATLAGAALKQEQAAAAVLEGGTGIVMPPGAGSRARFTSICTACHLCIDRCPNQVLTPAVLEYGLGGIYQPKLDFTHGYCSYECDRCTKICPTGALSPLNTKAKQKLQIGIAELRPTACLRQTEGIDCDNCVRHCPVQAIKLQDQEGQRLPVIDNSLCIGCGSCEYHCPGRPKAIAVKGCLEPRKSILAFKPKYTINTHFMMTFILLC